MHTHTAKIDTTDRCNVFVANTKVNEKRCAFLYCVYCILRSQRHDVCVSFDVVVGRFFFYFFSCFCIVLLATAAANNSSNGGNGQRAMTKTKTLFCFVYCIKDFPVVDIAAAAADTACELTLLSTVHNLTVSSCSMASSDVAVRVQLIFFGLNNCASSRTRIAHTRHNHFH